MYRQNLIHLRAILLYIILLSPLINFAQTVTGKVVDSLSGAVLPGASVYIANSTLGTTTDNAGNFSLRTVFLTRFELVVTYVGYQTQSMQPSLADTNAITIKLIPVSDELSTVTVTNFEKNGWERWGFLFKNTLIGTTPIGDNCFLKNPKDLRFNYSESERILTAVAVNPLIIVNKQLGYQVTYDLVAYTNNMNDKLLFTAGYAYFKPLKGNRRKQARWKQRRKDAYEGSLMQFMRAVYADKVTESGFQVRKLIRKPNVERKRIALMAEWIGKNKTWISSDSLKYYDQILRQSDEMDVLYTVPLRTRDFSETPVDGAAMLLFKDYLSITYPSKKPLPEYRQADSCITALLTLQHYVPVAITAVGSFYDPQNVIIGDYWGWSEKIGRMLPLDYAP